MNKRITALWKFLTYDIWRITEDEVTKTTFSAYNVIKSVYLCINRFTQDRLVNKASALTYSTLLAIVPILAIVFAIARGFGFDDIIREQIMTTFGGQTEAVNVILQFVNSYLSETKSGVFIGVGLILLLWTVLNLVNSLEITFNRIWQVKKARSMYRKITDYSSMLLLIPLLLVVSGGLSIYMSTALKHVQDYALLAPLGKFLIRLIPFALTWFMFTGLYIFMPNTKVKLRNAAIAGVIAGTAFQIFQLAYIYIQSRLTSYNAIYGSFAAVPLFLIWMQSSWQIVLFGAELSFAYQNIQKFEYEKQAREMSYEYHKKALVVVMYQIVNHFINKSGGVSSETIAGALNLPLRVVRDAIYDLEKVGLIASIVSKEEKVNLYVPARDVHTLRVYDVVHQVEAAGKASFDTQQSSEFQWADSVLNRLERVVAESDDNVLLKDLDLERNKPSVQI